MPLRRSGFLATLLVGLALLGGGLHGLLGVDQSLQLAAADRPEVAFADRPERVSDDGWSRDGECDRRDGRRGV